MHVWTPRCESVKKIEKELGISRFSFKSRPKKHTVYKAVSTVTINNDIYDHKRRKVLKQEEQRLIAFQYSIDAMDAYVRLGIVQNWMLHKKKKEIIKKLLNIDQMKDCGLHNNALDTNSRPSHNNNYIDKKCSFRNNIDRIKNRNNYSIDNNSLPYNHNCTTNNGINRREYGLNFAVE